MHSLRQNQQRLLKSSSNQNNNHPIAGIPEDIDIEDVEEHSEELANEEEDHPLEAISADNSMDESEDYSDQGEESSRLRKQYSAAKTGGVARGGMQQLNN